MWGKFQKMKHRYLRVGNGKLSEYQQYTFFHLKSTAVVLDWLYRTLDKQFRHKPFDFEACTTKANVFFCTFEKWEEL